MGFWRVAWRVAHWIFAVSDMVGAACLDFGCDVLEGCVIFERRRWEASCVGGDR